MVGACIREMFSILIVSAESCYAQQEMLMKEHTVEVAGI